jgi:hypothetical protein
MSELILAVVLIGIVLNIITGILVVRYELSNGFDFTLSTLFYLFLVSFIPYVTLFAGISVYCENIVVFKGKK